MLDSNTSTNTLGRQQPRQDRAAEASRIDNPLIRSWMEQAGYKGFVEVEIFSALDWWLKPTDTVVRTICERIPCL